MARIRNFEPWLETLIRLILSQIEAIERLTTQVEALRDENVELRAKLDLPPKTPDNSITPPSRGQRPSAPAAAKDNQVCLAHLIRQFSCSDVQYAIDAGDNVFAPDLRHLLGRARRIGRRRDKLADATLKTCASRLDARLDELMARTPSHEAGVNPRIRSEGQRFIKKIRRHMFVFVINRDLPATNNGSERALCPCAVFRKITNGFRTEWGAKLAPVFRRAMRGRDRQRAQTSVIPRGTPHALKGLKLDQPQPATRASPPP